MVIVACCGVCCPLQSDPELLTALNEMRLGRMTEHTRWLLSECKRPLPDDGISATHLFPHKKDVSNRNMQQSPAATSQ
jgi:hypothetical protein